MTGRVMSEPGSDANEIERLLVDAPSFQRLEPTARRAVAESMAKVVRFLEIPEGGARAPLAGQLAPDLRERLAPQPDGAMCGVLTSPPSPAPVAPAPAPAPPATAAPSGGGAVGRVGEVARATLSAIDFPQFVAALIQGTFQAIVDSSIQQMEAY